MPHCAWKSCARQSECLCIASEISAKLFAALCAILLRACRLCSGMICVGLPGACIQVPGVNPEKKRRVSMAKMKVALVPKPGADFEIVEREIPNPGAGHVRIRVQACGICYSDILVKEGH